MRFGSEDHHAGATTEPVRDDDADVGDQEGSLEDPAECSYAVAEHCQRGHQGWRWVRREGRTARGGVIDEPEECCVRVGPERPGPTGVDPDELFEDAYESKVAPTECTFNNEWHCRRAHQGWRWVSVQMPRRGGVSNEPRRCCVRVGPASEQWGHYR